MAIKIKVGKGHEIYGTVETSPQGLVFMGQAERLQRLVESMRLTGMSDDQLLRSIPARLGYIFWARRVKPRSAHHPEHRQDSAPS